MEWTKYYICRQLDRFTFHYGDVAQLARALDWQSRGRGFDSHLLHKAPIGAFFMFYVYIIYSEKLDRYYVGSCDDLNRRISDHNRGRSKYTKPGIPWILKHSESHNTRPEARKREAEIKSKKSRKYIDWLITSNG
jgi:putative endonuclease